MPTLQDFYVFNVRHLSDSKALCLKSTNTELNAIQGHDLLLSTASYVLDKSRK